MNHRVALLFALLAIVATQATAQDASFQRVFGMPRMFPADIVEQVKALPPGEKLERDSDGDGVADQLWYLDTDKRHTISPLLVCVVDEDGDLAETGRGDLDSDCYFWDHDADGTIDVVTDYQDDDGDGDVDQMGIFYDKDWKDDKDDITVWWAVDVGDDNRLWFDVNGTYYQDLCQWRTHFSGDELFYQFRLTTEDERWINVWEDPFAFYDPDGDENSEVVVRISAVGDEVQNLRYSIDADNGANGERVHDYDFSITALPPEEGLTPDPKYTAPMMVRGIETHPVLTWEHTMEFAQEAKWGKAMLTWDEINSNTDEKPEQDPHERWEGILNHASKHGDFEQVGGPPSSAFNKRVEVSANPKSPLRLYWDEVDHRFHLYGAEYGYMDVDYDLDGVVDAAYTWKDTDGDGLLDVRTADMDADGVVDFEQELRPTEERYPLTFEAISPKYVEALREVNDASQRFLDAAVEVYMETRDHPEDTVVLLEFFTRGLPGYHPETELGSGIGKSAAGIMFYSNLLRDRLFLYVRNHKRSTPGWAEIEAAYLSGDFESAASLVEETVKEPTGHVIGNRPLVAGDVLLEKKIAVTLATPADSHAQEDLGMPRLVVVDAASFKEVDSGFDAKSCAVTDGRLWIGQRIIPHQVDSFAFNGSEQLSFIADVPASESNTYYVYYSPADDSRLPEYPALTRAVLDTPAYVAWESDAGAYRFYTGQFDYFGKHVSRLLPREERLLYPIVDVNYHEEQPWGIDALHVDKTSGLGGLTIYLGDKAYPVQSPAGEGYVQFEHRVLGAGPVRAAVEITARNVFPDMPDKVVLLRCFIYAGRPESIIQVKLPEGLENPRLAPGLLHLAEEQAFENLERGLIGTWGRQGDEIGEIGLAVMVPPAQVEKVLELPEERQIVCHPGETDGGADFTYMIMGTWRRGMQYPIAPTWENWKREAEELSRRLLPEVEVEVE
jgi:hypothetical protein